MPSLWQQTIDSLKGVVPSAAPTTPFLTKAKLHHRFIIDSFIGNHCIKYFKAGVHKKLIRQLEVSLKHTDNQEILDIAFVSPKNI